MRYGNGGNRMIIAIDLTPDMAWALGLFEGEGSIVSARSNGVCLTMQTTDRDTLYRFYKIVGKGHFRGPYKAKGPVKRRKYRKTWVWNICVAEDVRDLLILWLPHLGIRRRARAKEALKNLKKSCLWKQHLTCRKGHKWTEETTYYTAPNKTKTRACRICYDSWRKTYNQKRGGN